ncbi:protocadherin alpha-C2-like [Oreochromis niloticus]|uniref:protocadherin alpha-C2-like n=1 Tax=Oreochromis niloticus TaxID=8128 RepID=UPI0003944FE3|nr:protocadherin alpha-C2-like [Oreochromis niloticus]
MERKRPGASKDELRWIAFIVVVILVWSSASAQIRYSIAEGVNEGTAVGNIAKDLGLEKNTLKERGCRIVEGSSESFFHVDQNDGILYVDRIIDREKVCERNIACLINLKTVLENPLEIHYVTVEIQDVNDHAPSFSVKQYRLEISESVLPGLRLQLQAAHDPDVGQFSVQEYKLSPNNHFRLEVKDRGKEGKIPILVLLKTLDRETKKIHKLLLSAIDGGKPSKSGTAEIFIDVLDVNDNMPVFNEDTYSVLVNENTPTGTTIVKVNASDLDEGSNGELIYSLGSNVNHRIRELFRVDPNTGEIIIQDVLDFESEESYEIDIQASDKGSAPLRTVKRFSNVSSIIPTAICTLLKVYL